MRRKPKRRRRRSGHAGSRAILSGADNQSEQVFGALDRCRRDQQVLKARLTELVDEWDTALDDVRAHMQAMSAAGINIPDSVYLL